MAVNTAFSFINIDSTNKIVTISTNSANDVGTYKILLTATI